MSPPVDTAAVLAHYPADCQAARIEDLRAAGGFSGAHIWRIEAARGELCLRCWPREHPSPEQLQWIHSVLFYVHARGFRLAPRPVATLKQASYVRHQGHLWELTNWLPGDTERDPQPSVARLQAALSALAQFHRAAEEFPVAGDSVARSPGLSQRLAQIDSFLGGGIERLRGTLSARHWPELYSRALKILDLFQLAAPKVRSEVARVVDLPTPLQPCLRDIWRDHVLFVGEQVTGLVDFGALRVDNPACDVARLLGSFAADDPAGWLVGLMAYRQVRPLSELETRLVTAFDQSAVLLSPLSWIVWVFDEGRTFDDPQAVVERIDHYHARLQFLTE